MTKCCKEETWTSWQIVDNETSLHIHCRGCNRPIFKDIYTKRFYRIKQIVPGVSIYEKVKDNTGYMKKYKVSCKRKDHIFIMPDSGGNRWSELRMTIKYTLDEFLDKFVEVN